MTGERKRVVIWKAVSSKVQAKDDKISLAFQEEVGRAWAAAAGHDVVAVLSVPGLSRSEADLVTMLEDFQAAGVTAYHDLRRMWYDDSFDVLWAYSFDRLGRSGTLIHYVGENTIKKGMSIYLHEDGGFMTDEDFRYKLSMASILVVSPMEAFRKKTHEAKNKLAEKGLPPHSNPCMSHRIVRDPQTGRAVHQELRAEFARLWQDLATLILEGVPWAEMERRLFERFQHVNPRNNQPWHLNRMYSVVTNPGFWGHSARQHRQKRANKSANARGNVPVGEWLMEPGHVIPKGVQIWYNTHPPVWTGEQAEAIKAELRRRQLTIKGHASPNTTHAFSSLVVCGECQYVMACSAMKKSPRLKCMSHWLIGGARPDCSQRKGIPWQDVVEEVSRMLQGMLDRRTPDLQPVDSGIQQRIDLLQKDITSTDKRLRQLILDKAGANEVMSPIYDEEIQKLSGHYAGLKKQLETELQRAETHRPEAQRRAFARLEKLGVAGFWQQPETQQNQMLHQLFGGWKLVGQDGKLVSMTYREKRFRREL